MKCQKRRYRDQLSAEYHLAQIQRIDDPGRPKLPKRAYRCPRCRGWHLTSQNKRTREVQQ